MYTRSTVIITCLLLASTFIIVSMDSPGAGITRGERTRGKDTGDKLSRSPLMADGAGYASSGQGTDGFYLKGAIVRANGSSIAIIEDAQNGGLSICRVGDIAGGGEVIEIARDRILVNRGGEVYRIGRSGPCPVDSDGDAESFQGPVAETAYYQETDGAGESPFYDRPAPVNNISDISFEELGENKLGMTCDALFNLLSSSESILQGLDARWEGNGMVFKEVAEDGVLGKMGFCQGDILKGVDGKSAEDIEVILDGIKVLTETGSVEIEIVNGSETREMTYSLTDFRPQS